MSPKFRNSNYLPTSTGEIVIKKKSNQHENEVFKWQQLISHLPNQYGDRFIARRFATGHNLFMPSSSFNLNEDEGVVDILHQKAMTGYYRMHNYKENLKSVLGICEPKNVLNFHENSSASACRSSLFYALPMVNCITEKRSRSAAEGLDWECKPRSTPLTYNNSTHDLPNFFAHSDHNIIAWSKNGRIAASFEKDLVLWTPPATMALANTTTPLIYKGGYIRALAFNFVGDVLALGIHEDEMAILQLWKFSNQTALTNGGVFHFEKKKINIRAILFDPSERFIICGMSTGSLHMIDYPLTNASNVETCSYHKSTISSILYSVHQSFIAVVDHNGKFTVRRRENFLRVYYELDDTDYFAWHPWNETDLFVARALPAKITLLDLSNKSVVAYYERTDNKCCLDAITLNPLSAELLAAFTIDEESNIPRCEVLVLASMNRVVDHLSAHTNSVKFLLWSPDGSYLATAGDDEALNIWNFFGKSHRKLNELSERMKKRRKKDDRSAFDLDKVFLGHR